MAVFLHSAIGHREEHGWGQETRIPVPAPCLCDHALVSSFL